MVGKLSALLHIASVIHYTSSFRQKYELIEVVDEVIPLRINEYFNFISLFFLAPGGVLQEKEMLVYDFYDLVISIYFALQVQQSWLLNLSQVGNVGGFLGLFLGASILSMYDGVKSNVQRLKYIVK